jgi:protein-histidine pros-kinase
MDTHDDTAMGRLQKLHDSFLAPPKSLDQEIDHAIAETTAAIAVDMETGVIVRAKRPAEILFGYDPGELQGKMIHDLVPQDVRAAHVVWFKQYADNPTSRPIGGRSGRLRGLTKQGTVFPADIALVAAEVDGMKIAIATVLRRDG